MPDINALFRARVGWDAQRPLAFEDIDALLRETALSLPFENLSLFQGGPEPISEHSLLEKIALRDEGGLCYELNPLLYLFLRRNGLEASLIRATIFDEDSQDWLPLGGTHVAILLWHQGQGYLLDCGYGLKQPLRMVPLCGEVARSANGDYRVAWPAGAGFAQLERRPPGEGESWRIAYGFDLDDEIADCGALSEIQRRIAEDPRSPFNKSRLMALLTAEGSRVLTEDALTETRNGRQCRLTLAPGEFETFRRLFTRRFSASPG
ncbi:MULTISPECIES: arylamine N-acetyltransferase [Chromobacterium]|uniref:arylamine N-acetyltransferase family protein n=1 Tax=Chromobacterium TaxID=535 RepID=UPI000D317D45|nr:MULTISPECIES: arylamine N-acetyltransferase [Chromobacterium]MCP1289485.1 arylamine N-acetyltransferase [Chromobacterium sp. S0633]PTU64040.1 arylamine N-acetyltransferase [Chromobacterium sp. Panama]UJB31918.1 arylamine N-acetyltransferase [Chromobacterium sp. Beijing]